MTQAFKLRRDAHSIGEFQASVQFYQPVSSAAFAQITERLVILAKELNLPAAMPMGVIQFAFGNPLPAPVAGVGYQRFAENGEVVAALACDHASITFTLRDYSHWVEVFPIISGTFATLVAIYITEIPAVTSVRLQYVNEFAGIATETRSTDELFRRDTAWLSSAIFGLDDDWHSTVGKYVRVTGDQRNLINVNAASTYGIQPPNPTPRTFVSATIMAGCFFNVPNQSPLVLEQDAYRGQLDALLEEAHTLEKRVLSELLSDPYLTAIGVHDLN